MDTTLLLTSPIWQGSYYFVWNSDVDTVLDIISAKLFSSAVGHDIKSTACYSRIADLWRVRGSMVALLTAYDEGST
jgi:hypothetical protein